MTATKAQLSALSELFLLWRDTFGSKANTMGIKTEEDLASKATAWAIALSNLGCTKRIFEAAQTQSLLQEFPQSAPLDFFELGVSALSARQPSADQAYLCCIHGETDHEIIREAMSRVDVFKLRQGAVGGAEHKEFLKVYDQCVREWALGARFTQQAKLEHQEREHDHFLECRIQEVVESGDRAAKIEEYEEFIENMKRYACDRQTEQNKAFLEVLGV
ncbi:MAG: hypothetical protein SVC26_06600 [Pseudomonadota bacterium]|nr:hypothetical protein [Pseudomonadota bacterium]